MTRRYCDVCGGRIHSDDPRYFVSVIPITKQSKQKAICWQDVCGYCASKIAAQATPKDQA